LIELCLKDVWACLRALGSEMEWSRGTTFQSIWEPDVEVGEENTHRALSYQLLTEFTMDGGGVIGNQMNPLS